jgi:hypothetical protein
MALIWNGTEIPSSGTILFNGTSLGSVIFNGVEVWGGSTPPTEIMDFSVSDNWTGSSLTITFTPASGAPEPTYDLYADGSLHTSGVTSGFSFTATSSSSTYYVLAINEAGQTPSNSDVGNAYLGPSSPIVISSSTSLVAGTDCPAVATLSLCIVGGGGSGASSSANAGVGHAGEARTASIELAQGETISVSIGSGGSSVSPYNDGNAGGTTSFGSYLTASGGAGGQMSGGSWQGDGGSQSSCGGTSNDGIKSVYGVTTGYGGQSSGFGPGGDGMTVYDASPGGTGSGGGGQGFGNIAHTSGAGGAGQVKISW